MKLEIILYVFGIIVLFLLLYSIVIDFIIISPACEDECKEKDAITSITIPNGEWNLNDYCTCFYENWSETFVLRK